MSNSEVVIGSRGSPLAMWQTNHVMHLLQQAHPEATFTIKTIKTRGDKILDVALSKIGDKGLFTKELEVALLEHQIDLAVHSLKDIPTKLPEGLTVGCICERHQPTDCVVMRADHAGKTIAQLPEGAVVGSSSLRRVAQLRRAYPHLRFLDVRGNVNTRLKKLDDGQYDALILATSGLQRLQLQHRIAYELQSSECMHAVGQGALAVECRLDDPRIRNMLAAIHHEATAKCCEAERALLKAVEGGCQVPVGVSSRVEGSELVLSGILLSIDGSKAVQAEARGPLTDPEGVGREVADKLRQQGGTAILEEIFSTLPRDTQEQ